MSRHRRWIVPLLWAVVVFAAGIGSLWLLDRRLAGGLEGETTPGVVLGLLAIGAVTILVPGVLLLVTLVRAVSVVRRRRGHLPPKERLERDRALASEREHDRAWRAAADLHAHLLTGRSLPSLQLWHLVLRRDEVVCFETWAAYGRYYGQDVSYSPAPVMAVGRPAFVLGALAGNAIGNSRRYGAAVQAATPAWRETQTTRIVVTNQRLMCELGGRWLSFDFGAMKALWPELPSWTFVCAFDGTEPLKICGPAAPVVSVMATAALLGDRGLRGHPALRDLVAAKPSIDRSQPGAQQ